VWRTEALLVDDVDLWLDELQGDAPHSLLTTLELAGPLSLIRNL
jgi:hypothetical protein